MSRTAKSLEAMALRHVAEYFAYANSPQAAIDRIIDRNNRAASDIRSGHRPTCTLTRCATDCQRVK